MLEYTAKSTIAQFRYKVQDIGEKYGSSKTAHPDFQTVKRG